MSGQIKPIPMTITRMDDNTVHVHGSIFEITMLKVICEYKDRAALKHIRRLWGVDLPTAKLLMTAGREDAKP